MSVLKKLVAQELVQLAPVFVASEEIEEKFAMHGWNACLLRNKFWREMEMQGHVVPEDHSYLLRYAEWMLSLGTREFSDIEENQREVARRWRSTGDRVHSQVREAGKSRARFIADVEKYQSLWAPYAVLESQLLREETEKFSPWVSEKSIDISKSSYQPIQQLIRQVDSSYTADKKLSEGNLKVLSAPASSSWKRCICIDTGSLRKAPLRMLSREGPVDLRTLDCWMMLAEAISTGLEDKDRQIHLMHLFGRLVNRELYRHFSSVKEMERNVRFHMFLFDVIWALVEPKLSAVFSRKMSGPDGYAVP